MYAVNQPWLPADSQPLKSLSIASLTWLSHPVLLTQYHVSDSICVTLAYMFLIKSESDI